MTTMTDEAHARLGDLLPAYALGALEGEELAELERHLAAGCVACQRELAAWRRDLERLAAEVPEVEPPAAIRASLLARVAAEASPSRPPRRRLGYLAAAAGLLLFLTGATSWLRVSRRAEELAAEAVLLETRLATVSAQLVEAQAAAARLSAAMEVLSAPATRSVVLAALPGAPGARARTFVDPETGRAIFYADHLPPLPPDRTYQLWFIAEGRPVSAGTFAVDDAGQAALDVAEVAPPDRIQAWAVTVEPAGGVPQPTGEMVLKG